MRIALGLEYDGSGFSGWQSQHHARGVQAVVEAALSSVADHPVQVQAAGRTDAGVHAAIQVVHFETTSQRTTRNWVLGANSLLPEPVCALWAREVPESFHARYSATCRTYRYVILNRFSRPALAHSGVCWTRYPLDHGRMHAAAQALVGEHDFSSFRGSECQSRTPMRRLYGIDVQRSGDVVTMTVTANAFLQHMVRNIAGVLIAIGREQRAVEWCAEVLSLRDRKQSGVTAPAAGLYLAGVRYAPSLQLPSELAAFHPLSTIPHVPSSWPSSDSGPSGQQTG
jgi:tRNA pseudouridine38-40 synthase